MQRQNSLSLQKLIVQKQGGSYKHWQSLTMAINSFHQNQPITQIITYFKTNSDQCLRALMEALVMYEGVCKTTKRKQSKTGSLFVNHLNDQAQIFQEMGLKMKIKNLQHQNKLLKTFIQQKTKKEIAEQQTSQTNIVGSAIQSNIVGSEIQTNQGPTAVFLDVLRQKQQQLTIKIQQHQQDKNEQENKINQILDKNILLQRQVGYWKSKYQTVIHFQQQKNAFKQKMIKQNEILQRKINYYQSKQQYVQAETERKLQKQKNQKLLIGEKQDLQVETVFNQLIQKIDVLQKHNDTLQLALISKEEDLRSRQKRQQQMKKSDQIHNQMSIQLSMKFSQMINQIAEDQKQLERIYKENFQLNKNVQILEQRIQNLKKQNLESKQSLTQLKQKLKIIRDSTESRKNQHQAMLRVQRHAYESKIYHLKNTMNISKTIKGNSLLSDKSKELNNLAKHICEFYSKHSQSSKRQEKNFEIEFQVKYQMKKDNYNFGPILESLYKKQRQEKIPKAFMILMAIKSSNKPQNIRVVGAFCQGFRLASPKSTFLFALEDESCYFVQQQYQDNIELSFDEDVFTLGVHEFELKNNDKTNMLHISKGFLNQRFFTWNSVDKFLGMAQNPQKNQQINRADVQYLQMEIHEVIVK